METNLLILIVCFFLVAMIYSSVGFGGGSSYLALLSLPAFMLSPEEFRPIALFCNIVVVTGGTIIFLRQRKIVFREVWPFLAASVPFAYLGGMLRLTDDAFFLLLGITLILSAFFLWVQPRPSQKTERLKMPLLNVVVGAGIGFLSGMVGIGGGIFLSPFLHLMNWSEARKISALCSLFILVNSVSGLAGQFRSGSIGVSFAFLVPLLLAVLIGGQIGSRLGATRFNPLHIKRITAALVMVAGINILAEHL